MLQVTARFIPKRRQQERQLPVLQMVTPTVCCMHQTFLERSYNLLRTLVFLSARIHHFLDTAPIHHVAATTTPLLLVFVELSTLSFSFFMLVTF